MRFIAGLSLFILHGCKDENPRPSKLESLSECQGYELGKDPEPWPAGAYETKTQVGCDQSPVKLDENKVVRVFFIRHAESKWGTWSNMRQAARIPPTSKTDAHLSSEGIAGALSLNRWIFSPNCQGYQCFLAGTPEEDDDHRRAVFAVSNLRRAVLTALIAFENRINETKGRRLMIDNIHVLSSLAEMTNNIDSKPLTPPGSIPYLTFGGSCPYSVEDMKDLFLLQCAVDRPQSHKDFCTWMRKQVALSKPTAELDDSDSEDGEITDFVLVGHSIWIREFFKTYGHEPLAKNLEAELRSNYMKFPNQGVVKFDVELKSDSDCFIVPGSAKMAFGKMEGRIPLVPTAATPLGSLKNKNKE